MVMSFMYHKFRNTTPANGERTIYVVLQDWSPRTSLPDSCQSACCVFVELLLLITSGDSPKLEIDGDLSFL